MTIGRRSAPNDNSAESNLSLNCFIQTHRVLYISTRCGDREYSWKREFCDAPFVFGRLRERSWVDRPRPCGLRGLESNSESSFVLISSSSSSLRPPVEGTPQLKPEFITRLRACWAKPLTPDATVSALEAADLTEPYTEDKSMLL